MNNPKIYIISGKASTGKNTVADIIKEKENDKTIIIAYASYLKEYAKNILNWDGSEDSKPRTFLQELGDLVKEIDPMFLVNRIIEDIEVYKHFYNNIIISDARFAFEIENIKDKYSTCVIRVNGKDSMLTETEKMHNTETSLDDYNDYDYVINNNDTIDSLRNNVYEILEDKKW